MMGQLSYSWDKIYTYGVQRPTMSVETDSHGRLYLSAELREKYGEKYHVVKYEDRIELIPIEDDPLQAVREAAGDAFEGNSAEELREEALEQAKQEAEEDLEHTKRESEDTAE